MKRVAIIAIIGVLLALGQQQGRVAATPDPDTGAARRYVGHHKDFQFVLGPGESRAFVVPKANAPVHGDLSVIGGDPLLPGFKTFVIIYDSAKNITAWYDLLSSGGPNMLATPANPTPSGQPVDHGCVKMTITVGGVFTLTREVPGGNSSCSNSSEPLQMSMSLWY
jgi:hypothetical protein